MSQKRKKYKIAVLSDLSDSSNIAIKSTVGLAKMIHGEIEVFCVKKPTDIVESENQLSAIRTINAKHTAIDKEMQSLTKPISEELEMEINYSFAFGNVKNEISSFLKRSNPDIIVLGKRKSKPFNLIRDGITEFVLNEHNGVVMITSDTEYLVANKEITFCTLNNTEPSLNLAFAEDLMKHTKKPTKSFKIIKNAKSAEQITTPIDNKTVEYVFEHNDGTIKNLSNYLSKNSINILSIDRTKKNKSNAAHIMMPDISSVSDKLDVTLLVSGK